MKSIVFKVNFEKLSSITSNGYDDVEFVFSANKGQEVKALAKTASGGELSRFMLALKNIFAEIGNMCNSFATGSKFWRQLFLC